MFQKFIGIDWSGDKKTFQKGIKIAEAYPGCSAPVLINGSGPKGRWSRSAVLEFIEKSCEADICLIGLDFAFGFPAGLGPFDWEYVETCCSLDQNFYGGRFFSSTETVHADFINSIHHKGSRYSSKTYRMTELAVSVIKGATPQTVFNAIGAAQVGPSSISGMRMLKALVANEGSNRLAVWPFQSLTDNRSAIVEIFPRLFPLLRGLPSAMRDKQNLNGALASFGSEPVAIAPDSEDEGDAIISAAALRCLSSFPDCFDVPTGLPNNEGWIFGAPLS